jgi:HD superfamily phosphohydrolase
MMALEIIRRIRDNLHGSISVTAIEDKVIAHPFFQRLRRIRQTAFLSFVFPGATHTRFEHSLGVMHLAGVAWESLQANQKRLAQATKRYEDFSVKEMGTGHAGSHGLLSPTFPTIDPIFSSDYTFQVFRLAALTHDLGHPPFSHSGERFLPSLKAVIDQNLDVSPYLLDYLQSMAESWLASGKDPGREPVRHEVFTYLLVDRMLAEIYQMNPDLSLKVPSQDVLAVLTGEIKPVAGSDLYHHDVYKLCNELVSGEFDIDRMDYLQRDSKECGVVYGIFDADRILDSLCYYFDKTEQRLHLAIQYSGLAAFEDYLRARQSMYVQLYFHKTSVAAEAMMQSLAKKLGGWSLPAYWQDYAKVDEFNVGTRLIAASQDMIGDAGERAVFEATLDNALYHRRLWKRIFELTGPSNAIRLSPEILKAKKKTEELGLATEQVSSTSYLTRFQPRQRDEASKNYLRLIKKDVMQFPRVEPLEDHTRLISEQNMVHISRLYVDVNQSKKNDPSIETKLMKAVTEALHEPKG